MTLQKPERRRFTVIGLAFQYISMALTVAQGLILVPLAIHHLSLALYGAWLAISNAVVWLTMLDPGVSSVFQQRIGSAYGRGDKEGMEAAIGTGLLLNAAVYGALFAAAAAVAPYFPALLHITGDQSALLVRCFLLEILAEAALSLAMTAVSVPMSVMAFPLTLGTTYSAATAAGLIASALLLVRGWGLVALPLGALVRGVTLLSANGVIMAWTCGRRLGLRPRLDSTELREISSLTGYAWLGRLGEGLTGEFDAFLVGHFLGPATVPIMTLTRNASDVIHQLASRFAAAFLPGLTHLHSERGAAGSKVIALRMLRIVGWTAAVGAAGYLTFNECFVALWVGPAMYGGRLLTALFAVMILWQALGRAAGRTLFAFGRIRSIGAATAAESLLRAGLLYLLLAKTSGGLPSVPAAGLVAAAFTGLWILPRMLRMELGFSWGDLGRMLVEEGGVLLVLGGLSAGWRHVFAAPVTWTGFILQGTAFVIAALPALAAVNPVAREEATGLLKGWGPASRLNAWWKTRSMVLRNAAIERRYSTVAAERGISYGEPAVIAELRGEAAKRVWGRDKPVVFWVGANHPQDSSGLLAALRRHAVVFEFRNSGGGYGPVFTRDGIHYPIYDEKLAAENGRDLLRRYRECILRHGRPDMLIGQMWANSLPEKALREIRGEGVFTVNIAMDDRLPEHWERRSGVRLGAVGLSRGTDLVLTTSPEACIRYSVEGCRSLFWPLASDPDLFEDLPEEERVHDVCFVGNKYGVRAEIISALEAQGIAVDAFGAGWPNGPIGPDRAAPLFSRSKIVLGIGTLGHARDRYTLKLRDFDGPMSGALYLTHRNPDLMRFFTEGREIVCYETPEECAAQIRRYLAARDERSDIARAGARKCRELYTWDAWFERLFALAGTGGARRPGTSFDRISER